MNLFIEMLSLEPFDFQSTNSLFAISRYFEEKVFNKRVSVSTSTSIPSFQFKFLQLI